MNTLSFPGLGIEPFVINKVAFTVFGKTVAWYGIIITVGIILAFIYGMWRSKSQNIKQDDIIDFTIVIVIFGVIGARLYYVFTKGGFLVTGGSLFDNIIDTFINIIAIWRGGLAIYGGIIAGALAVAVTAKIKKLNIMRVFDTIVPGVLLAQALGRWGNFFNVEAFGTTTDLPWRMGILYTSGNTGYVHPTFLYESLWCILGFILINVFYKHKKFDGMIFCEYVCWYGFGRFFIEGLRTDSLYLGVFRVSQLVAAVSFIAALVIIIRNLVMLHNAKLAEADYDPIYSDDAIKEGDAVAEAAAGKLYLNSEGELTPTIVDDLPVKKDDGEPDIDDVFDSNPVTKADETDDTNDKTED